MSQVIYVALLRTDPEVLSPAFFGVFFFFPKVQTTRRGIRRTNDHRPSNPRPDKWKRWMKHSSGWLCREESFQTAVFDVSFARKSKGRKADVQPSTFNDSFRRSLRNSLPFYLFSAFNNTHSRGATGQKFTCRFRSIMNKPEVKAVGRTSLRWGENLQRNQTGKGTHSFL